MDRNAPAALLDTAQQGYDDSKALIARWHGTARLAYAITPRFAVTSTPGAARGCGRAEARVPGRVHPVARVGEPGGGRTRRAHLSRRGVLPRRLRALWADRPAHDLRPRRASGRSRLPLPARQRYRAGALSDVEQFPGQRALPAASRRRPAAARARGPRHRPGRRHQLLDAAHDGGRLRGGAVDRASAVALRGALPRHARRGAGTRPRRPHRQRRARLRGRPRDPGPAFDAVARVPDGACARLRRDARRADGARPTIARSARPTWRAAWRTTAMRRPVGETRYGRMSGPGNLAVEPSCPP